MNFSIRENLVDGLSAFGAFGFTLWFAGVGQYIAAAALFTLMLIILLRLFSDSFRTWCDENSIKFFAICVPLILLATFGDAVLV